MTNNPISHLLESLASLTSLRDQHALEACLINTLQTLTSASQISLFEISQDADKHMLKLLADVPTGQRWSVSKTQPDDTPGCVEDDPDLMQCYTTGQRWVRADDPAGVSVIHPIIGVNGIDGFLVVRSPAFVEKDQQVVTGFLRIYQNYLQLINDNERDTLTGLLNRKTFDERIMAVMSAHRADPRRKSDSQARQCCLAVLDIDHFKKVNDQFGHLYGDEVLLLFAQMMIRTFRDDDLLFRYGGEEFVVVLKDVDLTTGQAVLERFRHAVSSYLFPQVGSITTSVGMVAINGQDLPTTLIGQADQALYYAKENGRNQVCVYERLLQEGKLVSVAHSQGDIELF
jgi:diguanylate cyclase (GGDEF)-like protein